MADFVASVIDTTFIGHLDFNNLGPVELAAVGVIAIFNRASKIVIFLHVSVTTSFVAEEDCASISGFILDDIELEESSSLDCSYFTLLLHALAASQTRSLRILLLVLRKLQLMCKALLPGDDEILNDDAIWETLPHFWVAISIVFFVAATVFAPLKLFGLPNVKPSLQIFNPKVPWCTNYSFVIGFQGVFRGFKDTKTPLYAIVIGYIVNTILDPILIFVFKMRVTEQVDLLPPNIKDLQLGRFLKNVIAATICVSLAASMSARLGSTQMAAFQICLQVWLTASLLSDGLAVTGQAILAGALARQDYESVKAIACHVLQVTLTLTYLTITLLGLPLLLIVNVLLFLILVLQ